MEKKHSGDRLKQIAKQRGISAKELADTFGISAQALNNWFNRGIPGSALSMVSAIFWLDRLWLEYGTGEPDIPGSPWTHARPASNDLARAADSITPLSLWDEQTPLDEDEVYVPFLKEVELSAGQGVTAVQPEVSHKLRFEKATLRRQNVQPDEAVCVMVSGNSMEPVLPDGSTVGINRGNTAIADGKMYAIDHGGHLRVKTLYRLPGGGIKMRSFNRDDHPDEEYSAEEMAAREIRVLGKVFWSSVLW